jgi:hypothetical protein
MSDYSAVAPPTNFSQSSAFAAALQRARQVFDDTKHKVLGKALGSNGNTLCSVHCDACAAYVRHLAVYLVV